MSVGVYLASNCQNKVEGAASLLSGTGRTFFSGRGTAVFFLEGMFNLPNVLSAIAGLNLTSYNKYIKCTYNIT